MHLKVVFLVVHFGAFLHYVKADAYACRFRGCSGTLRLRCPYSTTIRLGDLKFIETPDKKFNDTETLAIYSSCSYTYKCDYEVPDWHGFYNVFVQYSCMEPDTVVQLTANIVVRKKWELNLIYDMTDMTNTKTAPKSDISCDVISDTLEIEAWMEDFRGCPISKLYYNDAEEPIECNHSMGVYMNWISVQEKAFSETSGQHIYNFTINFNRQQPKGMFWLRFEALNWITLICSPLLPLTMTSHQPTLTSQTTSSTADKLTKNENKANTGAVVSAVVGAVVGAVVLVVVIVSVGCFIYHRRKTRRSMSADCKVAQKLAYDVIFVPERDADQTREPDQTDPAKHTTESQPDSIYHEPGTSSDVAAASSDIHEEDYNTIDFHSKKAFNVDLNYHTLAPHVRFVTDPNYSHISDVTTARNDTYSHIPAQPGTTTQGKQNESHSDDTYNHLNNTARLEVRGNNKDSSNEYSNMGNLPKK